MDRIIELPLGEIHADEDFNCRGHINPLNVVDLVKDIIRQGLIQPVMVAPYSDEDAKRVGHRYRLIAGFRRYKAHYVISSDRTSQFDPEDVKRFAIIKCMCKDEPIGEALARTLNLAENLQREPLNIGQEARAVQELLRLQVGEQQIAKSLGQTNNWVKERIMLLKLPPEIADEVIKGTIPKGEIRKLHTIHNRGTEEQLQEAVRTIKDSKTRGVKIPDVIEKMVEKETIKEIKRQRQKTEIYAMTKHLGTSIGFALHTKCLAWAAGEISDQEVFEAAKAYGKSNGVDYQIPTEDEWYAFLQGENA